MNPSTQPLGPGSGKSRPRGRGLQLYRDMIGAPNDEAAHAKARRVVTDFFLHLTCLRLAGQRRAIAALLSRFMDELATDPPKPVRDLILQVGRADRSEDEAREEAIVNGHTPDELRLLVHRTKAEVAEKLELIRAAEAELSRVA